MSTSVVGLTVFLTLAAALGAVVSAFRDLASRSAGSEPGQSAPGTGPITLRRLPRTVDDHPPSGPIGSFDGWFLRLVRDTGLPLSPIAGTFLLLLCGVVVGGAIFVWNEQPVAGMIGMCVGMGGAVAYLMACRTRHVRLLQEQLSTAMDMLAHSLRAGLSLDQAVELVGNRSPEPLAAEFRVCAKQLAMGLSIPAVMRSLVGRVRLPEVRVFTATLAVHRQTGGDVSKVLERLATVVRERLNYRRRLRAITGAGRLSAMLVGMIGPLLLLYLFFFHPEYMQAMLESPLGQTLLITAVVLESVGLIWTARLLRPAY